MALNLTHWTCNFREHYVVYSTETTIIKKPLGSYHASWCVQWCIYLNTFSICKNYCQTASQELSLVFLGPRGTADFLFREFEPLVLMLTNRVFLLLIKKQKSCSTSEATTIPKKRGVLFLSRSSDCYSGSTMYCTCQKLQSSQKIQVLLMLCFCNLSYYQYQLLLVLVLQSL